MEYGGNITIRSYVEISPHYDLWMRGAKYGTVTQIKNGKAKVEIDHDRITKQHWFPIEDLIRR